MKNMNNKCSQKNKAQNRWGFAVCLLLSSFLVACGGGHSASYLEQAESSSQQASTYNKSIADTIVTTARSMLGKPYRYGGESPGEGFDCSGLVFYSHGKAGISTQRTAMAQYHSAREVHHADMKQGDLLFYNIDGKPSHVGIYIGNQEFIHAPSSGKKVSITSMNNPYFKPRLVKIGRLY